MEHDDNGSKDEMVQAVLEFTSGCFRAVGCRDGGGHEKDGQGSRQSPLDHGLAVAAPMCLGHGLQGPLYVCVSHCCVLFERLRVIREEKNVSAT